MAKGFEELEVYRLAEELSDEIWRLVVAWEPFSRDKVGGQLARAADSIGANLAEGSGRGSSKENCHFARIARGSFYETRHFLRRAFQRGLLTDPQIKALQPHVQLLGPKLNAYIGYLARQARAQSSRKAPATSNEQPATEST